MIKDAKRHPEELDRQFWLNFPNPAAVANGKEGNLQCAPAGDTINGICGGMTRKAYQEQMGRRES